MTSEQIIALRSMQAAVRTIADQLVTLLAEIDRVEVAQSPTVERSGIDAPEAPAGVTDDNLLLIKGLDAAVHGTLSNLGVTRFAEVAAFTAEDVAEINRVLGATGRVQREGWIEQAAILATGKVTAHAKSLVVPPVIAPEATAEEANSADAEAVEQAAILATGKVPVYAESPVVPLVIALEATAEEANSADAEAVEQAVTHPIGAATPSVTDPTVGFKTPIMKTAIAAVSLTVAGEPAPIVGGTVVSTPEAPVLEVQTGTLSAPGACSATSLLAARKSSPVLWIVTAAAASFVAFFPAELALTELVSVDIQSTIAWLVAR